MKFQDYIVGAIQHSFDEVFRYGKAVPADKLSWKPLDTGRSVLDQLQEIAQAPDYVTGMLGGKPVGEAAGPDNWEQLVAARQAWTTLEDCQREAQVRLDSLFASIRAVPDEKLTDTQWLPYDGGRDFTLKEIMEYPRWNANYHLGAICYIQLLYGDKEMH